MRRIRLVLVLGLVAVLVNLPLANAVGEGGADGGVVVGTVVADVVLVVVALLLWRRGGRRRPQLRAIALSDVEHCSPDVALDRIREETYLVRGEVTDVLDDRVVIELGDRSVLVLLDDHRNPVGPGQPAQVTARLI